MRNHVETTVKAPDDSQIFAERIAQRMPQVGVEEFGYRVSLWGTYIDIELAKASIQNYSGLYDNLRVCAVGNRDLSFSEIYTTGKEAARLHDIACERKVACIVTDTLDTSKIWLSNVDCPEIISKEQIIAHLRAWDDGWK